MIRSIALTLFLTLAASADAQRVNPRLLRERGETLQAEFLKGLDELAAEYEQAGLVEDAKAVLRRRLEIADDDAVAEKLNELEELDFETRQREIEVDAAYGWTDTGVNVTEGQEVRVEAAGEYRLQFNDTVGPAGLSVIDELQGAKVGGLTAIIYPPRTGKKKPQPTAPFPVDARSQFEPEKSGRLFLRVAVPVGGTAKGTLKVRVSGKITAARP